MTGGVYLVGGTTFADKFGGMTKEAVSRHAEEAIANEFEKTFGPAAAGLSGGTVWETLKSFMSKSKTYFSNIGLFASAKDSCDVMCIVMLAAVVVGATAALGLTFSVSIAAPLMLVADVILNPVTNMLNLLFGFVNVTCANFVAGFVPQVLFFLESIGFNFKLVTGMAALTQWVILGYLQSVVGQKLKQYLCVKGTLTPEEVTKLTESNKLLEAKTNDLKTELSSLQIAPEVESEEAQATRNTRMKLINKMLEVNDAEIKLNEATISRHEQQIMVQQGKLLVQNATEETKEKCKDDLERLKDSLQAAERQVVTAQKTLNRRRGRKTFFQNWFGPTDKQKQTTGEQPDAAAATETTGEQQQQKETTGEQPHAAAAAQPRKRKTEAEKLAEAASESSKPITRSEQAKKMKSSHAYVV